jgi:acetyl-CoA C-acetyltransferase
VAAQAGWFDGEIVPVANETFELPGYKPRRIRLAGKATVADRDTHPRPTPPEVLAKLRTVFKDGVQTGGNSSALTDAAAAALVASRQRVRAWGVHRWRGSPPPRWWACHPRSWASVRHRPSGCCSSAAA